MQDYLIKQNTFASFIPFKICIFRSPTILFIDSIGSIVCAYRFEVKPIIVTIWECSKHNQAELKLISIVIASKNRCQHSVLNETTAHRLIMVIASLGFKAIRCLPHRSLIYKCTYNKIKIVALKICCECRACYMQCSNESRTQHCLGYPKTDEK